MTEEEQKKISILYFLYLRYFKGDKPKAIDEFTIEELQIEIENCKKLQYESEK